jgi:hypothetical protein
MTAVAWSWLTFTAGAVMYAIIIVGLGILAWLGIAEWRERRRR